MRTSYFSVLAVLVLATAAAAQSSSGAPAPQPPVPSTHLLDSWSDAIHFHQQAAPATDFRPFTFAFRYRPAPRTATRPFQLSPRMLKDLSSPLAVQKPQTLIAGPERCYAMRDYSFSRNDGSADATHLENYSSCRPATQAQLKEIAPVARMNR